MRCAYTQINTTQPARFSGVKMRPNEQTSECTKLVLSSIYCTARDIFFSLFLSKNDNMSRIGL